MTRGSGVGEVKAESCFGKSEQQFSASETFFFFSQGGLMNSTTRRPLLFLHSQTHLELSHFVCDLCIPGSMDVICGRNGGTCPHPNPTPHTHTHRLFKELVLVPCSFHCGEKNDWLQ